MVRFIARLGYLPVMYWLWFFPALMNGEPSGVLARGINLIWGMGGFGKSQMALGLDWKHRNLLLHGDLRTEKVLVKKNSTNGRLEAKLSNLDIVKCIADGSKAWQAPECLHHKQPIQSTDIFSMGCLFCYCLTKGNLPFGNSGPQNSEFQSIKLDGNPEATHLVSLMLEIDPNKRVSNLSTMMEYPFFWEARMRLDCICAISELHKRHKRFERVIRNYLDEMGAYFSKQWPNLVMELYKVFNRESHESSLKDLLKIGCVRAIVQGINLSMGMSSFGKKSNPLGEATGISSPKGNKACM